MPGQRPLVACLGTPSWRPGVHGVLPPLPLPLGRACSGRDGPYFGEMRVPAEGLAVISGAASGEDPLPMASGPRQAKAAAGWERGRLIYCPRSSAGGAASCWRSSAPGDKPQPGGRSSLV